MSNTDQPVPAGFSRVEVPDRIAELGFSFLLPADWRRVDLPPDEPKFDQPDYFIPLSINMAVYGAIVFVVAARPAYDDGAVDAWLSYLCGSQKIHRDVIRATQVGPHPAVACDGEQPSEAGPMKLRLTLLEDGGRMVNIMAMAPAALWGSVEPTLKTMIESVRLATPRGPTVRLIMDPANVPPPEQEQPAKPAAKEEAKPAAAEAAVDAASTLAANATSEASSNDDVNRPTSYAEMATADDAASLDPEHPTNARLRDNGVGFTPRVLATHEDEKCCTVGAGAIVATMRIPFGWHALDDGKRTLVYDPAGKIQVNLSLRRADGLADDALLQRTLAELSQEQSNLQHLRMELMGQQVLAVRGLVIDGERLEQAYLLRRPPAEMDGLVLFTRVTAAPDDMVRAMNLAEVLHRDLAIGGQR